MDGMEISESPESSKSNCCSSKDIMLQMALGVAHVDDLYYCHFSISDITINSQIYIYMFG